MDWRAQNEQKWRGVGVFFHRMRNTGVVWITCDSKKHLDFLIQDFISKHLEYQNIEAEVGNFEGGSLDAYLIELFKAHEGDVSHEGNILHLKGIERFAGLGTPDSPPPFFAALNWERKVFFWNLPFVLMIWSNTAIQIEAQRLAPDFWDWVADRYHFESECDDLIPDPEIAFVHSEIAPKQLTSAELEREKMRLARLRGLLEKKLSERDALAVQSEVDAILKKIEAQIQ